MTNTLSRIVFINGIEYEYKREVSLYNILLYLGFSLETILIDYNGTIISSNKLTSVYIKPNDRLEIITLAGGG
uniref:sulfur carrier protein ThiS adenylyltransferase n=1 Tax=Chrysotila carterae TaxID=13221 RepID=UPI0022F3472A|nr:sulfur carrier protein ThiS adenylyltransferase [Chrysotila carterae]WAK83205.1 sulfur carrier protein ThiS adenylyltransferase [Chrysotila carterae]